MQLALSTRWNARRHADGARLVEEIQSTGFSRIELSYDLRRDLLQGILDQVRTGGIRVVSIHNYCPVPMGAPRGHPEIWTFADPDPVIRRKAVEHTAETIRLAATAGADIVVVHAGYVRMKPLSRRLIHLAERGRMHSWWGRRTSLALDRRRERLAPRHLDWVSGCLERLLPVLDECKVLLGLENLPSWEAVPSELEFPALMNRFPESRIRYWHDIGHGAIREQLGWINAVRALERLTPWLGGFHVHDILPPAQDHVLPGTGIVDFSAFTPWVRGHLPLVLEMDRLTTAEQLRSVTQYLHTAWEERAAEPAPLARASLYDAMPGARPRASVRTEADGPPDRTP